MAFTRECNTCKRILENHNQIIEKTEEVQNLVNFHRNRLEYSRTIDGIPSIVTNMMKENLASSLHELGICYYNLGIITEEYTIHLNRIHHG